VRHYRGTTGTACPTSQQVADLLTGLAVAWGGPMDAIAVFAAVVLADMHQTVQDDLRLVYKAQQAVRAGRPGFRPGSASLRAEAERRLAEAEDLCRTLCHAWVSLGLRTDRLPDWLAAGIQECGTGHAPGPVS
jgi:hypothetical protein